MFSILFSILTLMSTATATTSTTATTAIAPPFAIDDPAQIALIVDHYVLARPTTGWTELDTPTMLLFAAVLRLAVTDNEVPPTAPHLIRAFGRLLAHALRGSAAQAVAQGRDWHEVGGVQFTFFHRDLRVLLTLETIRPAGLEHDRPLAAVSTLERIARQTTDERVRAAADLALQHVFETLADLAVNADRRDTPTEFAQSQKVSRQAITWLRQSAHPHAARAIESIARAGESAMASDLARGAALRVHTTGDAWSRTSTCADHFVGPILGPIDQG